MFYARNELKEMKNDNASLLFNAHAAARLASVDATTDNRTAASPFQTLARSAARSLKVSDERLDR